MKKLTSRKTNAPVYCINVYHNEQHETQKLYLDIFKTIAIWGLWFTALIYVFKL